MRALGLLLVVACGGSRPAAVDRIDDCLSPLAFGAIVDDGRDDRAALQRAVDAAALAGTDVCLPVGELHIGRRRGTQSSLVMPDRGIALRGVGRRSRLVMLGQPGDEHARDWWVIQVTGHGHRLSDFAMDGAGRGITDEQTHLIQVRGPASQIRLERLWLAMPEQTISRGGDCIRLLGDPGELVRDVTISDVHGEVCARSFIAFQRLVSDVLVERVVTKEVGGQAIDMEPSGAGAIRNVTIRNSSFRRGSIARGGTTIALAGSQRIASENLILEHSIIEAGIQVYRVHGATIRHNRILGGAPNLGAIKIQTASRDVTIEHNVIDRWGSSGGGIEIFSHNRGWPKRITIRHNAIVMGTAGFPIHGEPVQDVEITGNDIECKEPGFAAVFLRGVVVPIRQARVRGNRIRGHCAAAVRIAQHRGNVTGATTIEDNIVEGTRFGVVFENGVPSVTPIVDRNVFRGVPAGQYVVGAGRGHEGANTN